MTKRQFRLLAEQNNQMIMLLAEIACSTRTGGGPPVSSYLERVKEFGKDIDSIDPVEVD